MLGKEHDNILDEGEWVSTQMRLFTAGFRNGDRETLKTTYENILERYGQGVADKFLLHAYVENMSERVSDHTE